jgi:hypothetical protein
MGKLPSERVSGPVAIVSFMANRERQTNSGAKLRAIRQQLGWPMREVHAATVALAKKHRQPGFVIAPSRLYTLAVIYGRTWHELLSLYGIPF